MEKITKQHRSTPAKRKILALLQSSDCALCHENIEQKLSGEMDRVTIYRVLQSFTEQGIVHRIVNTDGTQYFALCNHCDAHQHNDQHLHFRCQKCEKISCLDHIIFKPQLPKGYQLTGINCVLTGFCPQCQLINDTRFNDTRIT